jgi:hypothetical protein
VSLFPPRTARTTAVRENTVTLQADEEFHPGHAGQFRALCLIRLAMLEASRLIQTSVGQLGFARA